MTPKKHGRNAMHTPPRGGCRAGPPGRGTRLAPAAKSALALTLSRPAWPANKLPQLLP